MNILITGSNGFIGTNLLNSLLDNHKIIKLVNGEIYSFSDDEIVCSLTNDSHIKQLLDENLKIDAIIHAASILGTNENINKFSLLYDNIKMYENLFLVIQEFQPKKVINLSSIAVYPNHDGEFTEKSEIRPSINSEGLYGLSKFCGENILDYFNKNNDVLIVHLRLSQVYGKGMREDRIMKIMEKELKETNEITVFGNGERVSNFIEINILIKRIIYFLNDTSSGIFNCGDNNISYKVLAENIIKEYGNSKSVIKFVSYGVSSKTSINSDKMIRMIK